MNYNIPVNDQWHFSHLGEKYFLRIANTTCRRAGYDAPILTVFIGKTGEPYALKKKGRQINPNWGVVLQDGRTIHCGPATGNRPEPGLWEVEHCFEVPWSVIGEYFLKAKLIK
jgi:hypothetical protein